MYPFYSQAAGITHDVIGAAIEVHKDKLLDIPLGLVINFHSLKLTDGVTRLISRGANDQ